MKILLMPYNWQHSPVAGGEVYLMRLAERLLKAGHELKAIVGAQQSYTDRLGIECRSQGDGIDIFRCNNDLCQWCDLMITQLLGNGIGFNKAVQHGKPLVFIAHNNSVNYAPRWGDPALTSVIYNSFQLRDELFKVFGGFNGAVLHPLPSGRGRASGGKQITLINCNENKGGVLFAQLAERLPNYSFQGVLGGYGEQVKGTARNLRYLANGADMDAVYAGTRILVVPSEFESYSQAAMEALECGIPVIATPLPGLRENLGDAGLFADRKSPEAWAALITRLMEDNAFYRQRSDEAFARAARVREKTEEELSRLLEWLEKIPK